MDSITPEYLHIILNHLPLIGFLAAVIPLLIGVVLKKVDLVRTGLLLVLLFGAPSYFIMETGEEAEDRLAHGETSVVIDELSHDFLHEHEERAETTIIAIYITLGLAVLCLVATFKMKKAGLPLAWITVLSLVVSLGLTAWTAKAGGQIRHPEFRTEADIKAMQTHSEPEPHLHGESHSEPEEESHAHGEHEESQPVEEPHAHGEPHPEPEVEETPEHGEDGHSHQH